MKNSKKIMVIALLLALALCLYYVAGTYAKYTTTATANSEIQVAKWSVKVGTEDISAGGSGLNFSNQLTLQPDSSTKVAAGKIAPDTTASGTFTIDTTASEVATKYTIEIGNVLYGESSSTDFAIATVKAGDTEITANSEGKYEGTIALNGAAVDITVTVKWTGTTNDNAKGIEAKTVTIPVTLTVEQDTAA